MKHVLFLILAAVTATYPATAQKKKNDQAALQTAIAQKTYTFHAQTALPASGRSRQLTSSYSFTIKNDSIFSDLPYFGRAYTAPMDLTKSVLQFNSLKFDYKLTNGKKGSWKVAIKINDVSEVQTISMNISANGYATLQAILTNRQAISFNGQVDQRQ
ncbi:MAG: DUF4251 domain-containing protein [Chitinophagaceae bacterium]|nr:DUF4251 domain-containing protein [Chitinophagaceae bacterium]